MARFDAATGRYVHLTIDGMQYRIYFEEAGAGIPLLLGSNRDEFIVILEDLAERIAARTIDISQETAQSRAMG